jgi:phage replication-related protein YjqB (UPF0714/DUF867 family)
MTRQLHTRLVDQSLTGHLVERRLDAVGEPSVFACAPHGGSIEPTTDRQAVLLAALLPGATVWYCCGESTRGAFDEWHITSSALSEEQFELLEPVAEQTFEAAVSFHGTVRDQLLVGGGAPSVEKQALRDALATCNLGVPVRVVERGEPLSGTHPNNIVNRYAEHGGIQLEQPSIVRDQHWERVVQTVADQLG